MSKGVHIQGPARDIKNQDSFFRENNKNKAIATVSIALLAISALITGGLLLYFKVNTLAAWILMGCGITIAIADAIGGVMMCICHNKSKKSLHNDGLQYTPEKNLSANNEEGNTVSNASSYHIVSWNVGSLRDYANMCLIKNMLNNGSEFSSAFREAKKCQYVATGSEKITRNGIFREAFQQFGNPDIICLQETQWMRPQDFNAILPPGYSYFTSEVEGKRNCTVIWNTEKFSSLHPVPLNYDRQVITNPAPDTVVLLQDKTDGVKICVDSVHLRGFSLADRANSSEKAKPGDYQALCDLAALNKVVADFYIFAGDLNATPQHYPKRAAIIRSYGYTTDETDMTPTVYDGNLENNDGSPEAVRLDYIFVKARNGAHAHIRSERLKKNELNDFKKRPSDHIPIGAEVTIALYTQTT